MPNHAPAQLAITGATGALGFAFVRDQLSRNPRLKVTLLVRRVSAAFQAGSFQDWLAVNQDRVHLVEGDVRTIGAPPLDQLLSADGGLWHFAALTSLESDHAADSAREIHEVNAGGTQRLVEAWRHGRGAGPFFHVSTAYVAGERSGLVLETESAVGQACRNPYEASKLAAEQTVLAGFATGLRGAIFRPSVVVDNSTGAGGFKMVDACAYAVALAVRRSEPFVFRTHSTAKLNMVHSDWVIAALGDLARLPSGNGRTYHLTAPRETYLRDIGSILEKLVPELKVSFAPDLKRAELPTASRIFDKAITDVRPYLEADIRFDRTNTDRDISPATKTELDLVPFVQSRLASELARVAAKRG
jgi:nucleoside-diphosphate-sugar epimerase